MHQKLRLNTVYRTMWVPKEVAEWKTETGIRWDKILVSGMKDIKANFGKIPETPQEKAVSEQVLEELAQMRIDFWKIKVENIKHKYELDKFKGNGQDQEDYELRLKAAENRLAEFEKAYWDKYEKASVEARFEEKKVLGE